MHAEPVRMPMRTVTAELELLPQGGTSEAVTEPDAKADGRSKALGARCATTFLNAAGVQELRAFSAATSGTVAGWYGPPPRRAVA